MATPPQTDHDVMNVRPPEGRRALAVWQIVVVGGITIGLASLFNAETLVETAERQPFGWRRDLYLDVVEPIHDVSDALYLDQAGEAFDEARGRNEEKVDGLDLIAGGGTTTTTVAGATTSAGSVPSSATPVPGDTVATTPTTIATTTTLHGLRTPTAEQPLKLWVGGDSMAQVFGQALERMAGETGVIAPTLDYRISTGLTRPDFFDWPAHFVEIVDQQNPEVMVVMFGANDAQGMKIEGQVYDVFDPEWQNEYRRRVGLVMDYLRQGGRQLVWVGQPIMESDNFSNKQAVLNAIYQEEAAKRPGLLFIDSWTLFSAPDGGYSAYLANASGDQVLMRQQDGIHLSLAGGDRLASVVLGQIQALYR